MISKVNSEPALNYSLNRSMNNRRRREAARGEAVGGRVGGRGGGGRQTAPISSVTSPNECVDAKNTCGTSAEGFGG